MNKRSINGHPVSFFVDQQHRTVGAVIKDTEKDAVKVIEDKCKWYYFGSCKTYDKFCLPMSFKAVAKCSPEDTFDVEIGMEIAYKRLKKKYMYKYFICLEWIRFELAQVRADLCERSTAVLVTCHGIDPLSVISSEMPSEES